MLAGALSNVELGEEIPAELYKAVAEVLIFVPGALKTGRDDKSVRVPLPRPACGERSFAR